MNHPEEPILLLAHPDRHLLPQAVEAISIEYEPLPAIFTIEESERCSEIIWGEDNIFKTYLIEKGDVEGIWEKADYIVEGEYSTGAQEQLYIENNGMIAAFDASQGITVWGSLQCPYYIHKALMALCNLPAEKVRVVQMETGGAFGGKEEYPSMIAAHAALLAMKSGRPVKIIYDRMEDMAATTKRHPSRTRHRTAVSRDGKILGGEIDFTIDGGAYATLSSVVLSRGVDSRRRSLLLAEYSHPRQSGCYQCAAPRSFSRLRRAAKPVCHGAAHGSNCANRGSFSRRDSPAKFSAAGAGHDHRTGRARAD